MLSAFTGLNQIEIQDKRHDKTRTRDQRRDLREYRPIGFFRKVHRNTRRSDNGRLSGIESIRL
jgi:hypothetical protein